MNRCRDEPRGRDVIMHTASSACQVTLVPGRPDTIVRKLRLLNSEVRDEMLNILQETRLKDQASAPAQATRRLVVFICLARLSTERTRFNAVCASRHGTQQQQQDMALLME